MLVLLLMLSVNSDVATDVSCVVAVDVTSSGSDVTLTSTYGDVTLDVVVLVVMLLLLVVVVVSNCDRTSVVISIVMLSMFASVTFTSAGAADDVKSSRLASVVRVATVDVTAGVVAPSNGVVCDSES